MKGDEMVRWHRRLDGYEFETAPGGGEGPGSLACGSPRGAELDTTELNNSTSFLPLLQSFISFLIQKYLMLYSVWCLNAKQKKDLTVRLVAAQN